MRTALDTDELLELIETLSSALAHANGELRMLGDEPMDWPLPDDISGDLRKLDTFVAAAKRLPEAEQKRLRELFREELAKHRARGSAHMTIPIRAEVTEECDAAHDRVVVAARRDARLGEAAWRMLGDGW